MPAKMRHAAFAEALAAQAANGRMLVVDEIRFDGDRPRARDVVDWLARVGQTGRAVLVTAETDERVGRATANLKEFDIRTTGTLRLEDVLRAETVLVLRPALDGLAARATVGRTE
jgi:ribosomal protein L4